MLKFIKQSRLVQYGIPFILFVVCGSIGLTEFTELRYKYRSVKQGIQKESEKLGIEIKRRGEVTLESEFEKIKNMDIDDWENKRIQRPWQE